MVTWTLIDGFPGDVSWITTATAAIARMTRRNSPFALGTVGHDTITSVFLRDSKSKPHHPKYRGSSEIKSQKSHARPSKTSYAVELEDYYSKKFGQIVTPIAALKTLAVISSTFETNNKLWILNVAPSRHLKTQTTQEQTLIFPKDRLVYVGSDFTIHGIIRDYDSGRKLDKKCILINDTTLLLASKAKQTKSRLIDAFSELASEGRYIYRDFQQSYEVKARFSFIANITPHSFLVNRRELLGNTFIERCLVVYHALTDEEMSDANLNRENRASLKIERFRQTLHESDVSVTAEDKVRFDEYSKRWRIFGAYSSSSSVFDMIKSVSVAYAILNNHRKITKDEYRLLDMLEPYLRNPDESVKLQNLELARQGRSINDICLMLDKNTKKYRSFVSRTLSEYRRKGILPWIKQITTVELT